MRDLVTRGIDQILLKPQRPKQRVVLPLIHSKGPKVKLTNKRIYELIEFP